MNFIFTLKLSKSKASQWGMNSQSFSCGYSKPQSFGLKLSISHPNTCVQIGFNSGPNRPNLGLSSAQGCISKGPSLSMSRVPICCGSSIGAFSFDPENCPLGPGFSRCSSCFIVTCSFIDI